MMIKKILFYLIFIGSLYINYADACEIQSYHRIIKTENEKLSFNQIAKKSDCPQAVKLKFLNALQSSKGLVRVDTLSEELGIKATITPNRIRVESLEELLLDKYNLDSKWSFRKIKSIGKTPLLTLNEYENIQINCRDCTSPGNKNIKITITDPLKGNKKSLWLESKLLLRSYALVSKGDFMVDNKPLLAGSFDFKEVFTENPENFFTKTTNLAFYKLNKPLRKGSPLLFSDITPVSLVKNGQMTTIILKSNALMLEGKAIPMKNGQLGDMIQLRNVKSNRIIIGKVVDFNKVVIDL